jgi:hypothetical protein
MIALSRGQLRITGRWGKQHHVWEYAIKVSGSCESIQNELLDEHVGYMAVHTGVGGDVSYFFVYSNRLCGTTNRGTLAQARMGALWVDAAAGITRVARRARVAQTGPGRGRR